MKVFDVDDAEQQAKARALSSRLRMRILRFCLNEGHTNREIAVEFALNPGTSLHHVRTLIDTGFLTQEPARTGRRGGARDPLPGYAAVLGNAGSAHRARARAHLP